MESNSVSIGRLTQSITALTTPAFHWWQGRLARAPSFLDAQRSLILKKLVAEASPCLDVRELWLDIGTLEFEEAIRFAPMHGINLYLEAGSKEESMIFLAHGDFKDLEKIKYLLFIF